MARKSKFDNQICYIDDPFLMGNFKKTPYVCIFRLYSDPYDKSIKLIDGINMDGKEFNSSYSSDFVYKKIEIVQNKHLGREFIERLFDA